MTHDINNNNNNSLSNFIELLPMLQSNSNSLLQKILSLVWHGKLFEDIVYKFVTSSLFFH